MSKTAVWVRSVEIMFYPLGPWVVSRVCPRGTQAFLFILPQASACSYVVQLQV